jgi:hypothetical protein
MQNRPATNVLFTTLAGSFFTMQVVFARMLELGTFFEIFQENILPGLSKHVSMALVNPLIGCLQARA